MLEQIDDRIEIKIGQFFLGVSSDIDQVSKTFDLSPEHVLKVLIEDLPKIDKSMALEVKDKIVLEQLKPQILKAANYIINDGLSTRKVGQILEVSNFTIHTWMTKKLPLIDPKKAILVQNAFAKKTSNSTNNDIIKKRIMREAKLVIAGYKISDIVLIINNEAGQDLVTENIVYHDLTEKLAKICTDEKLVLMIKSKFLSNRMANLYNHGGNGNNPSVFDQPRGCDGRFLAEENSSKSR